MSDPTHDAPRTTPPAAEGRRRWLPTYQQWRLGVLMTAIVLGITGMSRNDDRLVKGAIGVAIVGVLMRVVNRIRRQPRRGEGEREG